MIAFANATPATRSILEHHVADNDEVLPHVLMADLRRYLVDLTSANDPGAVANFLHEIERLASSTDPDIRNVVDVSFVEDLVLGNGDELTAVEAIRAHLGPATTASLTTSEQSYRR